MPTFRYTAKNKIGKTVTGVSSAKDKDEFVGLLRKEELTIISVEEVRQSQQMSFSMGQSIRLDDIVIFSRQLATMVEAGIPLVSVLDVLTQQTDNQTFSKIIGKVRDDVETGSSMSQAIAKHPRIFSQLYINMVKAGESSGTLDEILNRVATYLEQTAALQRKVKAALVYPVAVIIIAISITIFLLVKVVPTFKGIFDLLGGQLPVPTQVLLSVSDFARSYFLFTVIGLVVFVVIVTQYNKTDTGRYFFDSIKLKLPVFGDLIRKVSIAKFSRTLSTLVKSGVPILTSLEIVGKTSGNRVIESAVESSRKAIRDGKNIADPLGATKVFPAMVVRMIAIGEQTGELEKMLTKVADFYDEQVNAAVESLTSAIEPMIIVFLGLVVGGIVLAIFMPIFKITELLGR